MKRTARWIAAAAFALSTPALADTVTISWANPVTQPGPVDGVHWQIVSPAHSGDNSADRFVGTVTAFTGALTSTSFVDSQAHFLAYCHDLLQTLHSGTYTVNYSVDAATLNWLGAVNYVLNGNSNTWVDSYAWLHPANGNVGAAIQLGIWDALYDGDFDLTTGNFRASNVDAASLTAYNLFAAAVLDGSVNDLPANLAMLLTSGDNQDVVTGRRPGGRLLPEPGSLLLLAIGSAVAGWSLRRKK